MPRFTYADYKTTKAIVKEYEAYAIEKLEDEEEPLELIEWLDRAIKES